jgi:hypothetical protein
MVWDTQAPWSGLGQRFELPGVAQDEVSFGLDATGVPASSGPRKYNLFLALFPARDDSKRVTDAARELRLLHGLRGLQHLPERLHITLHGLGTFLGSVPCAVIDAAEVAASRVACRSLNVEFVQVLELNGSAFVMRPSTRGNVEIMSLC